VSPDTRIKGGGFDQYILATSPPNIHPKKASGADPVERSVLKKGGINTLVERRE